VHLRAFAVGAERREFRASKASEILYLTRSLNCVDSLLESTVCCFRFGKVSWSECSFASKGICCINHRYSFRTLIPVSSIGTAPASSYTSYPYISNVTSDHSRALSRSSRLLWSFPQFGLPGSKLWSYCKQLTLKLRWELVEEMVNKSSLPITAHGNLCQGLRGVIFDSISSPEEECPYKWLCDGTW
jgi:hypothetical protein